MKKFATAINCMDGRVQIPVIDYLKKNYNVDYVDMITLPGADKMLIQSEDKIKEHIKKSIRISIEKHHSQLIAIVGHHDCAGNPVEKEIHIQHILAGIETIKSWGNNVPVIGLWVDENWEVTKVA